MPRVVHMVSWGIPGPAFKILVEFISSRAVLGAIPAYPWPDNGAIDNLNLRFGGGAVGSRLVRRWPMGGCVSPLHTLLAFRWVDGARVVLERAGFRAESEAYVYSDFFAFGADRLVLFGTFAEYEWAWMSLEFEDVLALPVELRAYLRPPMANELGIPAEIAYPELDELVVFADLFGETGASWWGSQRAGQGIA